MFRDKRGVRVLGRGLWDLRSRLEDPVGQGEGETALEPTMIF